ncbi:MAG: lysine--tRNA ligase [Candidatus Neomarinimicrobiota bacterium]|nr:lysine--tRNA ligase [Candidatus Neomarinimicrobiota bacterium]|tara:strand:- start:255 stop:1742 length:1488 start_codon:yes stop_codon:yes gene_type:complete
MSLEKQSLKEIINFRLQKLKKLRESGIDPYPHNFKPSNYSNELMDEFKSYENKDVVIAGRIMALRKMGKASFFHLEDAGGRIQVYIKKDDVGESQYDMFKLLDIGDFAGVNGFVFKTKTKEISVHAKSITVLAKSTRPLPIVKEKDGETFDSFDDKEQRYRNRHLDLIVNPGVKEVFKKRALITSALRSYLDNEDFLEVETPVLQPLYGGANARPFKTHHNSLDQTFYLRIADELYLKRLIIGGCDRVYELSKDFRNEGMDRNHNPEFTMLEWYEAYSDYKDQMNRVEDIIRFAAKSIGKIKIDWGDIKIDLSKKFDRKPFLELLKDATGKDLLDADEKKLRLVCKENKIEISNKENYGQLLDELMRKLVEPNLIHPVFVIDHPKEISPLAKSHRSGENKLVERFELFIGGAEFANSFSELNDPLDQRVRLENQVKLREEGDEEAQPIDDNFIEAMECGMPPTGGVGLGVDRLVMLLTDNRSIRDVLLFPAMRNN